MKNKSSNDVEKTFKWYRSPLIHFPMWLTFTFVFIDLGKTLQLYESLLTMGIIICVTAVSGLISKMFYLRIPFLGKYIYDNNYLLHANLILIAIGICILIISIVLGGFEVISNFQEVFIKKFVR